MIKKVAFFTNGNVMVFNEDGEQIPKLQGFIAEVIEKIFEESNINTEFEFADWNLKEAFPCNFKWWFERTRKKGR